METPLLIGTIFLLAGFVQGVTGFGSALVAMPLLCLILDLTFAVPLCILNSIIITTYLAYKLHNHLDRKKLIPLCLATLPGIPIGATLLKKVDPQFMGFLLGFLLILYGIYNLTVRPQPRNLSTVWSYIAGFSAGVIGAAFSAGGPPVIIYTTQNNWKKDEIKATLTGFFCFTSYVTAAIHLLTGITTRDVLQTFLFSSPFVLAGTVLGSFCYGYFAKQTYLKVIYLFLVLMGSIMITSL